MKELAAKDQESSEKLPLSNRSHKYKRMLPRNKSEH